MEILKSKSIEFKNDGYFSFKIREFVLIIRLSAINID